MGNDLPLVCICLPTFNVASTVRETLASILAQTYSNLVVHVSDNASTDDTLKVIESIADSRVHIHRNDVNIGGEGNFNRCIQLAEGKYTAIFHADDVYESDMVASQVAFLERHPAAGAVFTNATIIDEEGRQIGAMGLPKGMTALNDLYDFSTLFKAILRHSNVFICPSAMVRTQVYQQEIKCWRGTEFKSSADLDIWLRILQKHPVGYLQQRLMRYRLSDSQGTAQVRLRTGRADFFLVADHYLAQAATYALLDAKDLSNYKRLERTDRVTRAINLFVAGQTVQVTALLHDIPSWDALAGAFRDKRGMLTLLGALYIIVLSALRLRAPARLLLAYMKRISRK